MKASYVRRKIAKIIVAVAAVTAVTAVAAVTAAVTGTPHNVPLSLTNHTFSRTHRVPIDSPVLREATIPEENWNAGHRGVDFAADPGDRISASRGGVVHFAGVVAGTPVVSIMHSDGVRTTYEPVIADVQRGDTVTRGQTIGTLADPRDLSEHARAGDGLSWGAKVGADSYIDPLSLLGTPRIVLKQ